ncbi:MAG: acyl carrier protein [Thermoanaerobaculia bacterium]
MADEITTTVVGLVRETLALDDEHPISPAQLLFYDLAFSSMDLLDLLFRVEDRFGVAIESGTLHALARGELPEEAFATDGFLTETGRRRLLALLDDSPAEIFPERIPVDTLPRYCTVAAIARLVRHRLGEGAKGV